MQQKGSEPLPDLAHKDLHSEPKSIILPLAGYTEDLQSDLGIHVECGDSISWHKPGFLNGHVE